MSLRLGHTETDGSNLKSGENLPSSVPVVRDKDSAAPLEILVRRSTNYACPPGVDSYRMKSRPRGNVLIVNNIEFGAKCHNARVGSQVDSANLESLFLQLGFDVTAEQNLPLAQMRKAIIKHSELESHENADMSVVCILSHGEENNKLSTADCEKITSEWVVGKYRSDDSPFLHRKPKLFIIQACRGSEEDSGVKEHAGRKVSTDASGTVPSGEDILIVNATVPRFVAHRDTIRGSWFIECFCEVVMERAFNTDLRDMLDEVAERLRGPKYQDQEGNKQIFESANRHFRKKLFFNPGLYEDTALHNGPLATEMKPCIVQAKLSGVQYKPSGVQASVKSQFAGAMTAVDGGASNDALDGGTRDGTVNGGASGDALDGGTSDALDGGTSVALDGGTSDGVVDGGTSDDVLDGGTSDDSLDGGTSDALDGGTSNGAVDGGTSDGAVDGGTSDDALDGGTRNDAVDGDASDGALDGGISDDAVDGGTSNHALDGGTEKILDPNSQEAETETSLERSNGHVSRKSLCLNESTCGGNDQKEDDESTCGGNDQKYIDISLDVPGSATTSDDLNLNENLDIVTYMDAPNIGTNDQKEAIEIDTPLDGVPENEIPSNATWYMGFGAAIIVLVVGMCIRKFHYYK